MKYVFITGCPRSGTTWLQMLLAQHPAIATSQETHLFSSYVSPLRATWEANSASARGIGMPALLSEKEFDRLCVDLATAVLDKIAANNPRAEVILEKTPAHVRHLPLILKLLPEAYIIHLVRDPRAVAVSLTKAGRSWGSHWAAAGYAENARRWVADVTQGQRVAGLTRRSRQVHYEELVGAAGAAALAALLRWLSLDVDSAFCENAFDACRIDRLRDKSDGLKARDVIANDASAFYGEGKARAWVDELTKRDLHIVEHIAGERMRAMGYTPELGEHARQKPLALRWHGLVDGVEWRASRLLGETFKKIRTAADRP